MKILFTLVSETTFAMGGRPQDGRLLRFTPRPVQVGILGGEVELYTAGHELEGLKFELGRDYQIEFTPVEPEPVERRLMPMPAEAA